MALIEADGALTIRVIAYVPYTGAEWESLGSGLGSMALFFPQFIMSHKHTYTRTQQLLKWLSLSYKAHGRNAEVRISEAILQGDI